jgi:hypothetical protein
VAYLWNGVAAVAKAVPIAPERPKTLKSSR